MTDLNYLHLYYFWTASKERGFLRASKKLAVSQSTVSTQIRLLEKSLGRQLIKRGPRLFELTEDGQKTFASCEQIFSAGESLIRRLSGAVPDLPLLRCGADKTVTPEDWIEFQSQLAKESLSFRFERQSPETLFEDLAKSRLDVAICATRPSQTGSSRVLSRKFRASSVVLVGKSKWQRKAKENPKSWPGLPLCLPPSRTHERRYFDDWARTKKFEPLPYAETDDVSLLKALALEGAGISMLPYFRVRAEVQRGALGLLHEFRDLSAQLFICATDERYLIGTS